MSTILAIAPHPDDETLGMGGTLLRHKARGDSVHWLIVTTMPPERYDASVIERRRLELNAVASAYGFASMLELGFPTTALDQVPAGALVGALGDVVKRLAPEQVYLPFPGDAHSDHHAVFRAAAATMKWFRYPSVRRVLVAETLSETDFGLDPTQAPFRPNVYVDISAHLERKLEIMRLYAGETAPHPFPRSEAAIRAQATLRGAQAGCVAAEAFMLLKEIVA